jgi:peptidoglycan/xylan/chitin deacetylase (PgdA/CDA1 family)
MDLVGGQISVSRAAFADVGGFDRSLTEGGTYGHEDVEFGYRLLQRGYTARFEPQAVSRQRYTVGPRAFLRQARQSGRGSVTFARKHPELADVVMQRSVNRHRYRWLAAIPLLARVVRTVAVKLVDRGVQARLTERVFFAARSLEFCTGLREAGGMPRPRPLRVLAYHAIEPRQATGRFAPYEIQPDDFRRHIDLLLRAGYQFVSATEALHFLRGGGGLPKRPLLLTFDDCYVGVLDHAVPVLQKYRIPAVAFAVTGFVGRDNGWSAAAEGRRLPLLDVDGLRRLVRAGVEVGAHSRTHPPLPTVADDRLVDEVAGSCDALRTMGLGAARLFSYPYGESDEAVRGAVRAAGCEAAFTVAPGVVRARSDPFQLPRIEVLRGDRGWRFLWKVFVAGALREPRQGRVAIVRTFWRRWAAPTLRARLPAMKVHVAVDGGMHGSEGRS